MNLYFIISAAVILVADQVTKYIVVQKIPMNNSIEVIKGFFYITPINNTGAAFGMFQGYTRVLTVVSIIAIFLIIFLKAIINLNSVFYNISLGFILGGAMGNLVDRYFAGEVTDFLNFSFFGAVFNVADLFINVGFCITIIIILREYFKKKKV